MLATTSAATMCGISGQPVRVEVHVASGLPAYTIVGLPDATCRESRDRVRAAILSSGLTFPQQRVTVNLAPSGLRKIGAGLDLAIAMGILVASEQATKEVVQRIRSMAFLGELGLDGAVRGIAGTLPMAAALDADELVVPMVNAGEAELLARHVVRPVAHLTELLGALDGKAPWPDPPPAPRRAESPAGPDLAHVRGQPFARLAAEVAAAGGHHLLLVGPPGAGKTMLAERVPSLLPRLDPDAALEVTSIHSAAAEPLPAGRLIDQPPFRAPHQTASMVSIIGGGSHALRPGEVSLAHRGVLFMDEMGEFPAVVLDGLRQPLESGSIRVSRAQASATMPAGFLLVAAMNPCPCGHGGSLRCECSEPMVRRYRRRVSGPLLDRFDLRLVVDVPDRHQLADSTPGESSASVACRVAQVRARARQRGVAANSRLAATQLDECSILDEPARAMLERALDEGRLSGRGLVRVRAVALTLDDLRGGDGHLDREVVAQALMLRTEIDLRTDSVVRA